MMAFAPPPILHARIIASYGEFGNFEKMSGGDFVQINTDHHEAGARSPIKVSGTYSYTDIVISRGFKIATGTDLALLTHMKAVEAGLELPRTVVKQYLGPLGVPLLVETYVCKTGTFKTPDAGSGDNSVGMIEITLAVERKF